MPPFLVPIVTAIVSWFGHNTARFIGVVLIGSILIGAPMVVYHNITKTAYNNGYKAGYKQAVKDHPTVSGNNNTIITGQQEPFFLVKIWKLRLGI